MKIPADLFPPAGSLRRTVLLFSTTALAAAALPSAAPLFSPMTAAADPGPARAAFRQAEEDAWREYIRRFPEGTVPGDFDVTFYHLDVEIAVVNPSIQGSVLCRFASLVDSLSRITLDLQSALSVVNVTGNAAGFEQAGDTLSIDLDRAYEAGEEAEVTVHYGGVPQLAGGYKGLRYSIHGANERIVASLSTPFLAHYWWPCKDGPGDKADSVWLDITIPDTTIAGIPLTVVSNGDFTCVTHGGEKNTYHWRHGYPIVPYYVMVAISNYQVFQEVYTGPEGETFPLIYWVFDEHYDDAQAGVDQLPEAMTLFSEYFGAYPFAGERYGMTQLGFYGGIENQTNTIIGQMSPDWLWVSVHELAHQWFGDMITCRSCHHGWLNEGFATYCEALWEEHTGGQQAYINHLRSVKYLQGGSLYLQDDTDPFGIFISIIYDKGAWVLHMLRGLLGDEIFFQCLAEYAADPELRYGHATTEDFQTVCETVSGRDLNFFFDQWVYDERYPAYEYSYHQDPETYNTSVTLRQVQSDYGWREVFEMPLPLRFYFTSGQDSTITVWNDQQVQQLQYDFDEPLAGMLVDPDDRVLKTAGLVVEVDGQETAEPLPRRFALEQNYPNPFNAGTTLRYRLDKEAEVRLEVFNIAGQKVATVASGRQGPGSYTVRWNGRDDSGRTVGSGVYSCRLTAGERQASRKMLLLR
jgi:aminopeptidase N